MLLLIVITGRFQADIEICFNTSMLLLIRFFANDLNTVNQFQYIHVTINHYTSANVTEILLFQYIHVTINPFLFEVYPSTPNVSIHPCYY